MDRENQRATLTGIQYQVITLLRIYMASSVLTGILFAVGPVPDVPPPSFEEATAQAHFSYQLYSSLHATRSAPAITRPSLTSARSQIFRSTETASSASTSRSSNSGARTPISLGISRDSRDGRAEWENDRTAGLTLEERVRREFERRQLDEALPRASNLRTQSQETQGNLSAPNLPDSPHSTTNRGRSTPSRLRLILTTPTRDNRDREQSTSVSNDWVLVDHQEPAIGERTPTFSNTLFNQSTSSLSEYHSTQSSASVLTDDENLTILQCTNNNTANPSAITNLDNALDQNSSSAYTRTIPSEALETLPSAGATEPRQSEQHPANVQSESEHVSYLSADRPLPPLPAMDVPLSHTNSLSNSITNADTLIDQDSRNRESQQRSLDQHPISQDTYDSEETSESLSFGEPLSSVSRTYESREEASRPTSSSGSPDAAARGNARRRSSEGLTELDLLLARLDDRDATADGRAYDVRLINS